MAKKTKRTKATKANRKSDAVKVASAIRASQPTVIVKIILFVSFVYLVTLAGYTIFRWVFIFTPPEQLFGVNTKLLAGLTELLLIAISATIATKIFFIDPMRKFSSAISATTKLNIDTKDEFGELAANFNKVITKFADVQLKKTALEKDLRTAQNALRGRTGVDKKSKESKVADKELETLVKEFALLYEIGQKVSATMEMSELYRILEDLLPKKLHLQKFSILIVDEKREFLSIKSAFGFEEPDRIYDISFKIGEGISGEVMQNGQTQYVPDVDKDPRFLHYQGESIEKGSFLSIPLRFKKDTLGVLNCSKAETNAFEEDEIRLLTMVANQIALAVENALLYTKTRELSIRDELTGLYNRRHFQQVLQMEWKRAIRFRRPLSILMVDIDHFKDFNDTFGHPHGDKILKAISGLILKNLREVDTVARFGGEEFIILLPDTDRDGAYVVGEKLRALVEEERFDEDQEKLMPLTVSVGISTFLDDAKEMDDLIDHADIALYEAKDSGRNVVVIYSQMQGIVSDPENSVLST